MVIKAVITALDGVLVDLKQLDEEAFRYAVKSITGVDVGIAEQIRDFGNLTFNAKMAILNLQGVVWWDKLELVRALYHEQIFNIFSERIHEDNAIILMGECLRNHGLSFACVTNKDYQVALFGLERCGILSSVQYIITPDQTPMGKPAAFGYRLALKLCQVKPNETLVIESDWFNTAAAKNLDCHTYQLPYTSKLDAKLLSTLIGENNA